MSTISTQNSSIETHCNDNGQNCYYVGLHKIDSEKHDAMARAFFHTYPLPLPKRVFIEDLDLTRDCSTHCLHFLPFDPSIPDNTDLTPRIDVILGGPDRRYSIQLLRGLVYLYNVDVLEFSKAWDGSELTTVFKAVSAGSVVYYGDLTAQFPVLTF